MRNTLVIAVFVALSTLPSLVGQAAAGSPRTHDGLFLHLSAGGGTASTELDVQGLKTKMDGATGDINFSIGGVVAKNLALHGTVFGWLVSDPDVSVDSLGSGTAQGDLDLTGYGAGLTYYFMPANIFVSGSLGTGKLSIDTPAGTAESDNGIVGEISVGKEWWLGGSWGLGLSGSFGFHSIPDGDIDENWTGNSFALRLSATMN
jgi:hypothetical protein